MRKTVLITGGTGYLGTHLVRYLNERKTFNLVLWYENVLETGPVPQADAVVHLAALPNSYKGPENDITRVNYEGVVNMVKKTHGAHFLLLSSDYVFPGDRADASYAEEDPVRPTTVYGQAKAEAERHLNESAAPSTILRAALLYGYDHPQRQNFFRFLADKLAKREKVGLFTDVGSCPTYVPDLCRVIEQAIAERMLGTYHACGSEYFSRFELGRTFCAVHGLDPELLDPVEKPPEIDIPQFLRIKPSPVFEPHLGTTLEQGLRAWARES